MNQAQTLPQSGTTPEGAHFTVMPDGHILTWRESDDRHTRLSKLIEMLEHLPPEKLNMKEWGERDPECGTTACIAGWATIHGLYGLVPVFKYNVLHITHSERQGLGTLELMEKLFLIGDAMYPDDPLWYIFMETRDNSIEGAIQRIKTVRDGSAG